MKINVSGPMITLLLILWDFYQINKEWIEFENIMDGIDVNTNSIVKESMIYWVIEK